MIHEKVVRKLPLAVCILPLALIAACSQEQRNLAPHHRPRAGLVGAPLDEARAGFFKALADSGYVRDSTITVIDRNAQGDIPTLSLIMSDFLQQGVTQVATISSVATQAALKAITDRPIIFGAVANPYVIGAGTSPTKHRPNVTGAEIPLPVDSAVVLAHEAFPTVKVWGTLFDPSDPFAEFYLEKKRGCCCRCDVHYRRMHGPRRHRRGNSGTQGGRCPTASFKFQA